MEMIEKRPDKPWNWTGVGNNPNLTMEMIEKHSDKPWNWFNVSQNPNLTMEMIEKHSNKPWNWFNVSQNPNLTMEMIEKHPKKPWNWACISFNKFSFHPHLLMKKNRWRKISKRRKSLMDELNHVFDMPPNCSDIGIFKKGGFGFHETWRDIIINDNK
jgi:hypothetical protein